MFYHCRSRTITQDCLHCPNSMSSYRVQDKYVHAFMMSICLVGEPETLAVCLNVFTNCRTIRSAKADDSAALRLKLALERGDQLCIVCHGLHGIHFSVHPTQ